MTLSIESNLIINGSQIHRPRILHEVENMSTRSVKYIRHLGKLMFGKSCREAPTYRRRRINKMETIIPGSIQNHQNSTPKRKKNPQKSTPNQVEIETGSVKRSRETLRGDLGGARGAIFPPGRQHQAPSWDPKSSKNEEKMYAKKLNFSIGSWKPKL